MQLSETSSTVTEPFRRRVNFQILLQKSKSEGVRLRVPLMVDKL